MNAISNMQNPLNREINLRTASDGSQIAMCITTSRQNKGINQRTLAKLVGVSPVYICKIENGTTPPSRDILKKLSPHLGIPYAELLDKAGYNNATGDFNLYRKDGSIIDQESLLKSIYKVDAELLDYLMDFEEIGSCENVQVLKAMLSSMRKEVRIKGLLESKPTPTDRIFGDTFLSLKNFVLSLLTPMLDNQAL